MLKYAIMVFRSPSLLLITIIAIGIALLVLYVFANDDNATSVGGGVATLLFLPCLIAFVVSVSAGAVVGVRYVADSFKATNEAMDFQIEQEYSMELKGLNDYNNMFEILD